MNGGRAERNEYILLHEFHRLKYICPDKTFGKKPVVPVKVEADNNDPAAANTAKGKKEKYKGGLVLPPKRGLWDKFVLVMDFNSLYPSIIQEYNIDFTTVDSTEDEVDDWNVCLGCSVTDAFVMQDGKPPAPDVGQGVLPRLIATLVNRRRQVKSLMKDRTIGPAKLLQVRFSVSISKLNANLGKRELV